MISVQEALNLCLAEADKDRPFPAETLALDEALGRVLADDVHAEIDSPPFDKALMDGFAVRSEDIRPDAALAVLEEITAGQVPVKAIEPGTASRIMTGAPMPSGADAVVRVEDALFDASENRVQFSLDVVEPGTSILHKGAALKVGETVLESGVLLRPQELGVLAELGKSEISVKTRPRVAVLATGDELVPVSQTPEPGQIRNSNETMLAAQITRAGGVAEKLGIARDERSHLAEKIRAGLKSDLLILSGGVSAGTRDLVPSELAAAGVKQVFHKVDVKPGKPVWFGVKESEDERCLVFGLPGNPVSSMVCFELFARSVIRRWLGFSSHYTDRVTAKLAEPFDNKGDRPVYHPAALGRSLDQPTVQLVPWMGSADLRATVRANAMAVFPEGNARYAAGTLIDVIPW